MMKWRRYLVDDRPRLAVERDGQWLLLPAEHTDLVAVLDLHRDVRDDIARQASGPAPDRPVLPFQPVSLRGFANWEQHWQDAARVLARRHLGPAWPAVAAYERLTGRTFPALKPGKEFYQHPAYYHGNPLNTVVDGDELPWPAYTKELDFELEIGFLLTRSLRDATPQQARAAIGGCVVFNDLSARDVQWREHRDGLFGPVVKTKSFANAMSATVACADDLLDRIADLPATVTVNGDIWSHTSTRGMRYTPAEMLAWASRGETLHPGELFTSGTVPGGSGLELDRWLHPQDVLTLHIHDIATLTNPVGQPR
jgi:2-keto-4-pentenoate hydratase/2-oxohepta-3-ene-1,7-dioic acid hydratase in catechol pathway